MVTKVYGERQPVIVRAKDAGVHFGNLVAYEGRTVWLEYSRRLWKWSAKKGIALSGVAIYGLNEDGTKLDVEVPKIVILDACEIIECSTDAAEIIRKM